MKKEDSKALRKAIGRQPEFRLPSNFTYRMMQQVEQEAFLRKKRNEKKNFHPVGRYSDSDGRKRTGLSCPHLHEKSFRNRRNIEKYTGRQFLASDIPGSPDGIHVAGSPQLPAEHPKIPQIHGERKVAFRKASCLKITEPCLRHTDMTLGKKESFYYWKNSICS